MLTTSQGEGNELRVQIIFFNKAEAAREVPNEKGLSPYLSSSSIRRTQDID